LLIISHRGNLNGPEKLNENKIFSIITALNSGFDVEIDLWKIGRSLFLGHEAPQHKVILSFLNSNKKNLWIHAKNHEAFLYFFDKGFRVFWHQNDDFALTSKGDIWAYPGKCNFLNRIEVVKNFDFDVDTNKNILGICTDYANFYKKKLSR